MQACPGTGLSNFADEEQALDDERFRFLLGARLGS